jgi:predicted AlkP superfamily phosphohydrolase/phosphomutase
LFLWLVSLLEEELAMLTDNRPAHARQLLIGLDAAEWALIVRWAAEGKLPTFRRFMEEGTRAVLATTAAQLPDTVWASLYTGCNPAKLEKYFYVQYDPRTMGLRNLADDAIRSTPFWELLGRSGKQVGVVDAPKFPLSRSLHGFQLTNWGAHATKTARASYPDGLIGEIEARFGRHPVGDCDAVDNNPTALHGLRQRVLDGIRLRGEVNRWLMRERPWDVFFTAFSETHCIGHHFWGWLEHGSARANSNAHPSFADPDGLADTVEQVYRAIDREIGAMLALVDGEIPCLLFAAHGMGAIYHASWNLPEILDLLGYGPRPMGTRPIHSHEGPASAASAPREARVNPWRMLKMAIPGGLQYRVKAALPRAVQDQLLFRWYTGGRRWAGCRAFAVPNNDSVGAIRVSVRGRDRHGLVEPGEEYRRVCRDIASALGELTDPESGRPVVRQITLSGEEFTGPYLDRLPDLTVLWDQTFRWVAIHSPRFGTLRLRRQDARSGSHTPHGFLLAMGPGIARGEELSGHSIYDIAPTVLAMAGVPVPSDMDGRPVPLRSAAVHR